MKNKISILIPAHNEEKIISRTLNNIIKIPLKKYEILIGLDGCTDNTKNIVKEFSEKTKKLKYFELKSRSGKPDVIDYLIKNSTGDIIVIHDADWVFYWKDKNSVEKFFEVFHDENMGGIAESFPVEWEINNLKKSNFWYKAVAYGNYYWMKYQKDKFSENVNNLKIVSEPAMFLTNIFLKDLYSKNKTLGDDFERTRDIFNRDKKIVFFEDIEMPRMVSIYHNIKLKDLFRQKIRTGIARNQISHMNKEFSKFKIKSGVNIIINSWRDGFFSGIYATSWLFVTFLGEIISKFKKIGTKEGWKLRAKR